MTKTKRILLTLLPLIGLGLSIELCVVYYNANFAIDAQPSICAINEAMDCDGVAKTAYSQFLGIPLSLWGVFLYLFFLFMTYVDKIKNLKFLQFLNVFKNPTSYMFCVGLLSFLISMTLGCISIFKINSICIFCFMTYFVNLLIAIVAKTKGISIIQEFKISVEDFIEAIKVKKYAFWFSMLVLLFSAVLFYTEVTNVLTPQIAKQKLFKAYAKNYENIVDGNKIGSKNPDVVIHEYVDFNCGGCYFAHLFLHRVAEDFENVQVIQHTLPLDITCNPNMQFEGHKNSCLKAKYAHAASKQNKYWQMSDMLFEEAPETEKEIIEEARLLDLDIKKLKEDAYSQEVADEIRQSILDADSKGIQGTPTMFIGMKFVQGANTYPYIRQIVIEQGGIEKQ